MRKSGSHKIGGFRKGGAGVWWTPLPQAEAPTEPTGEIGNNPFSAGKGFSPRNCHDKMDFREK